jgi:hypothetical protein
MGRRVGNLEVDRARARQVVLMLAGALGLSEESVFHAQSRPATTARRLAFTITRNAFAMSLARVAVAFGRDRSSIAEACKMIEERRDDLAFDRWMTALENSAAVAPAPSLVLIPDPVSGGKDRHLQGGLRE